MSQRSTAPPERARVVHVDIGDPVGRARAFHDDGVPHGEAAGAVHFKGPRARWDEFLREVAGGVGYRAAAVHKLAFRKRVGKVGFTCQIYEAAPQLRAAEPDWRVSINHLAEWLTSLPKPVAILTWSTSGAREIIYACHHPGLMVPEEVSLVAR